MAFTDSTCMARVSERAAFPIAQTDVVSGAMWLKARDTLNRICDMAEEEGVVFALENLNRLDHPGCPFGSTGDVLSLVSAVDRPQLRINLDLYHTQIGEGDLIRWCQKCLPMDRRGAGGGQPRTLRAGDRRDQLPRRRQGAERHGLPRPRRYGGFCGR